MLRPLPASLLCAVALALAACGEEQEFEFEREPERSGTETRTSDDPGDVVRETGKGPTCARVEKPSPKPDGGQTRPEGRLAENKTYQVVFKTSCGRFTIRLDQQVSPNASASFANLTRTGFFDNTVFHRIVPGFIIQGGDPTGTGGGGPGYFTHDEPPPGISYLKGAVAMAKAPQDPPGTAGSQFYIVTAPDAGVPSRYALLGRVVEGQAVVDEIGTLGDLDSGDRGVPLRPVVIERATLVVRR